MPLRAARRVLGVATSTFFAGLAVLPLGCSRQPDLDEVFEPPRLAEPTNTTPPVVSEFRLTPDSHVELTFGSRKRRVQGRVGVTQGQLQLDVMDLASARGSLTFDLLTTVIHESADNEIASAESEPVGSSLTEQSLRWLQVADPVLLAEQPQLRYAQFSIQKIGKLSAPSAREGQEVHPAPVGMLLRRVQLWATGELELHGFRLSHTAPLSAVFQWRRDATLDSPPERIEIVLSQAVSVDLLAHGIVPRDARGDLLAETLAELRKLSATEARLTARWTATRVRIP